ncbi:MAG: hypothetical protein AAGA55_09635 [Planctomycetota bacterium]
MIPYQASTVEHPNHVFTGAVGFLSGFLQARAAIRASLFRILPISGSLTRILRSGLDGWSRVDALCSIVLVGHHAPGSADLVGNRPVLAHRQRVIFRGRRSNPDLSSAAADKDVDADEF